MAIDIHKMFCSNKVRCLDTGGFFFANMEKQEETVFWTILVTEIKAEIN